MMWTLTRIRRKALRAKEGEAPPQTLFWGLVAVAVWLMLAATVFFSLSGYVALGRLHRPADQPGWRSSAAPSIC